MFVFSIVSIAKYTHSHAYQPELLQYSYSYPYLLKHIVYSFIQRRGAKYT